MGDAAMNHDAGNLESYAHPEYLVSTEWVAQNLTNPDVRIVESNEDPLLYPSGHIAGAYEVDWVRDLNDQIKRDYLDADQMSELLARLGVGPKTTIVLYGDKSNWWATFAFWVFSLYGVKNLKIMNGGRLAWEKEKRELTKERPKTLSAPRMTLKRNESKIRMLRDAVLAHVEKKGALVDVRSPEEYAGTRLHMEGYPNEGSLRGGHIPGAKSMPWAKAINPETGLFKSAEELRALYVDQLGLKSNDEIVAYCRIGERSSHTWFVLTYLLGFPNVKNYDGSWTEYGNLVGAPIER